MYAIYEFYTVQVNMHIYINIPGFIGKPLCISIAGPIPAIL